MTKGRVEYRQELDTDVYPDLDGRYHVVRQVTKGTDKVTGRLVARDIRYRVRDREQGCYLHPSHQYGHKFKTPDLAKRAAMILDQKYQEHLNPA